MWEFRLQYVASRDKFLVFFLSELPRVGREEDFNKSITWDQRQDNIRGAIERFAEYLVGNCFLCISEWPWAASLLAQRLHTCLFNMENRPSFLVPFINFAKTPKLSITDNTIQAA